MQEAPQPAPQPAPEPARAPQGLAYVTAAAAVLALSAVFAWTTYSAPGDRPLSPAAVQARAQSFQQAGPLHLEPVPAHERAAALKTLDIPTADRTALLRQVDSGQVDLIQLTLWDDCDQDGDIVSVASDGFRLNVLLTHAPKQVFLPRPKGGVITIGGVHDGGGGITVAAATSTGNVPLPVMAPGQLLGVPVR